jgi:hypothetical protein
VVVVADPLELTEAVAITEELSENVIVPVKGPPAKPEIAEATVAVMATD